MFVLMSVHLPYSVQSFTEDRMNYFKSAVTSAVGVEDEAGRVLISSISRAGESANSIVVAFSFRVPPEFMDDSENILAAMTMENINVMVYKLASRFTAPGSAPLIESVVDPASVVLMCKAGHTSPNGRTCVACEEGKFKNTTGSAACLKCPANTNSSEGI